MPTRPTTDAQKRSAGSFRPSTSRKLPELSRSMPRMPLGLSKQAKTVWKRIVPQLAERGVLSDLDAEALAVLCILRAEFESDPAGFSPPKLSQLRMLLTEFGLTPASRARVPVLDEPPAKPDARSVGVASIDEVRARLERRIAEGK